MIKISTYYVLHASEYNFTALDELVWHSHVAENRKIWVHPKERAKKYLDTHQIKYNLIEEKDIKDLRPEEESQIWGYFEILDPIERGWSELFDLIKFKWEYVPINQWDNWYGFLRTRWHPIYELGDDYLSNPPEVNMIHEMFKVLDNRLINDAQIEFIKNSNLDEYSKQPLIEYLSKHKGRYLYMTN